MPGEGRSPLIELENVTKRFKDAHALRGVTAKFDGRLIGLLGPNGAGKSTLMKGLLGLTPIEGKARVLGLDPQREGFAIRDRVGYMPESDAFLADLNAVETVVYAGELSGLPRAAAMVRAHGALDLAGLEDKRYLPVAGYSTGMRQRVKIAAALVHDPELLFLDEPTNGLDPAGREAMLEMIASLPAKRNLSVILSTHLLPDVERLCDQVVVLHEGMLRFSGSVAGMTAASGPPRVEVRVKDGEDRLIAALVAAGAAAELDGEALAVTLPEGADAALVFRAARAAGVQVRGIRPRTQTLEAAFLKAIAPGAA